MSTDTQPNWASELGHFTGSQEFFTTLLGRNSFLYTEGVKFVAEKAGAFWLIDLIASHRIGRQRHGDFLTVRVQKWGGGARIKLGDGNGKERTLQQISYTDWPFDDLPEDFKFFLCWNGRSSRNAWTMMLPSEY